MPKTKSVETKITPVPKPTEPIATKSSPETAVPAPLQDEASALKARIAAATKEVEECKKALQAILPGDRPVYIPAALTPGHMISSHTYIPDVLKPKGRALRWSHKKMVDYHRAQGYSPCDWDRMQERADQANIPLRWSKTAEGHIQNGDLILMETSWERREELQALKRARNKARDGQATSTMKAMERELKARYGEAVDGMEVIEGERGGAGAIATRVPV